VKGIVGFLDRFAAALAFFARIVAAFKRTPLEDREPKLVAREIDRLFDAERARAGNTGLAPDPEKVRGDYPRHKREKLQWLGS
jgi:hypothetical protein